MCHIRADVVNIFYYVCVCVCSDIQTNIFSTLSSSSSSGEVDSSGIRHLGNSISGQIFTREKIANTCTYFIMLLIFSRIMTIESNYELRPNQFT